MAKLFGEPDTESAQRVVDQEKKRAQGFDWSEKHWRPKSGTDGNLIRLLPARAGAKVSYHLYAAVHFIKHVEDDKTERFVCNRETYGTKCPACEEMFRLIKAKQPEEANKYRPKRFGVFNVIDREKPEDGVKLYEAPVQGVYQKIMQIISSKGRMSNLFDKFDKSGKLETSGRDLMLVFDKTALPQSMYNVYPTDPSPLGTEEEMSAWAEQIVDLDVKALYPEADFDLVTIKTFGNAEERDLLRDDLRKQREAASAEEAPVAEETSAEAGAEDVVEEAAEEAAEEAVPAESEDDTMAKLEAQMKELKERKALATKQAKEEAEKKAKVEKPKEEAPKPKPAAPKPVPPTTKAPTEKATSTPPPQEKLDEIKKKIEAAKARLGKK